MLPSFEFWQPQSLFFLWLNEQKESLAPVQPLPGFQLPSLHLEKPLVSHPITSSSEGEEPLEAGIVPSGTRSGKRISRQGGPTRSKEDETEKDCHDPCFNPKKQKKNRNVLSNLVHHLLKYLSVKEMVSEKLARIIRFHQMSITIEEFYLILEHFEDKLNSYVTEKNFKTILMGSLEQADCKMEKIQEFSKMMRILSYKFYKDECISSVIHSNKLSYDSKRLHFQGLKDLLQVLQNLQEAEEQPGAKNKKSK